MSDTTEGVKPMTNVSPPPPPNFTVFESRGYKGFEKIDSGGQGNVYRTFKDSVSYAIKVVHLAEDDSSGSYFKPAATMDEDLKRELAIVRNLKHKNCIRVEELLRTKNKIYIVMDFMPGGTIGQRVRREGPLCEWNAKAWFCPVGRAIKYLHEHRIAHRDLKLDNILLDAYQNPILTDFGFSRWVQIDPATGRARTISDTFCGTPTYHPPEIVKHIPYNPFPGDVWCLGVSLFIMLNQIPPFSREKPLMYKQQMRREYKFQDSIQPKLSTVVLDLIELLLEPEPSNRPDIQAVCKHPYFPVIYSAVELPKKAPISN